MHIENSVILITGANRGLGLSLAEGALARGARRVYATARDRSQLAELVERHPGRVVPLQLDVTDAESIRAAAAAAPDVNVLINNAGALSTQRALDSDVASVEADFAVNFFGVVAATRAFLPALERGAREGGAALVNVLSVASLASVPAIGAYSASKAAAFSFTQGLRRELAAKNIRVHAVFPGPIDTDMVRGMDMPKTAPSAVAAAVLEGVTRGREDIAPDPAAESAFTTWRADPKALERHFAEVFG